MSLRKIFPIAMFVLGLLIAGGIYWWMQSTTEGADNPDGTTEISTTEEVPSYITTTFQATLSAEADEEADETPTSEVDIPEATGPTESTYENWDHIANSLSKYLIWSGDEVAMVENCPGGYYQPYGPGTDYLCEDPYNRWLQFEWLDGTVVPVEVKAGENFLWDWRNIGGSSFQQTITPDEKYWIYLDTWSDDEHRLVSYDIAGGTEEILMSFYAYEGNDSCNGIRFFGWNESTTKLGIVANSDSESLDHYLGQGRVFILTIEGGKIVKKSKYLIDVLPDCSPNNGPFFTVGWYDEDTIGYYTTDDVEVGDYDQIVLLQSLFWSDERFTSEYVHFYDVD
jgi:hypothetical protein